MGQIICLELALAFVQQGALLRTGVDHLRCKCPTWGAVQPSGNYGRCEVKGTCLPYPPPIMASLLPFGWGREADFMDILIEII